MNDRCTRIAVLQGGFPSLSATFILDQLLGLLRRGYNIDNWSTGHTGEQLVHARLLASHLDVTTRYLALPPQALLSHDVPWLNEFYNRNPEFALETCSLPASMPRITEGATARK